MCIHSLCVSTHRLLACESSVVTMDRMHHPAGVGRWSSSHVMLGTVRQARLLSGLFPLLWSVRQLSFVLAPSWTVGLKRPNVMDVDLFQGDRNWEASKTTGFTTTSALWRRLSQHWVELDRQENWKAFSDVMGELTSTAAALEDWWLLWRIEEELSAEVHYGNWKALKGDCQDSLLTNAPREGPSDAPSPRTQEVEDVITQGPPASGSCISLLVLQRLDSHLWRCGANPSRFQEKGSLCVSAAFITVLWFQ